MAPTAPVPCLTFIRRPVERLLSFYGWFVQHTGEAPRLEVGAHLQYYHPGIMGMGVGWGRGVQALLCFPLARYEWGQGKVPAKCTLAQTAACPSRCLCLCFSASCVGLGPRHSTGYPGHQRPVRPPLPPLPTAGAVWWNVHRERGASQHYGVRGRCCDCQASTGEVSVEPIARPYAQ